tara:strand:- start:237 stop:1298 length:1062 start_codon:yes stop_codon:yes gene_type:complete
MNKTITTLTILISMLSYSYSQDNIIKCNDEREYGNAIYIGCLDVENRRDGFGVLNFNTGDKYEGYWSKGKKNGLGKYTSSDGAYYEGDWVNDKQDGFGKVVYTNGDLYEGYFKNGMRNGEGKLISDRNNMMLEYTYEFDDAVKIIRTNYDEKGDIDSVIESEGSFFSNGEIRTGTQIERSQNGNKIIKREFENGDEVVGSEKSNIKNYYNEDEIEGDLDSIIIELESEPDDDTKFVNIKFKTKTPTPNYRFVFDTGAEVFSIGYKVFNELKENGLEYEDMNIIEPTEGVSGIPMDNKVVIIKELTIGQYKVKNVIAFVETLETATSSLLGIGFMKKFKNVYWSLNIDQLILFK